MEDKEKPIKCKSDKFLGCLKELQKKKQWGIIIDKSNIVGTFMKYKCNYMPAFELLAKQKSPTKDKMANFVVGACIGGGASAIDCD